MNPNDIVAIALLFVAVTDTLLAQTLLPRLLRQNPDVTPEHGRKIIRLVNGLTVVFFLAAIFVYIVRPL